MKHRWDKKYLYWGITAFLVILASLLCFGMIFKFPETEILSILSTFGWIIGIFKPILYGLVFAFLMNPIVKILERLFTMVFKKPMAAAKKPKKWRAASRATCIVLTIIIVLAAISGLLSMIIPQLVSSITGIVENFGDYYQNLQTWLDSVLKNQQGLAETFENAVQNAFNALQEWLKTLPKQFPSLAKDVADSAIAVVVVFKDLIIGFIIAIYLLFSKEKFIGQSKKLLYALFKKERANKIITAGQQMNQMFGGFLIGQIVDSLIVGALCFIAMSILGLPFSLLISVIVTVTNVIPFFGPFIGAIPSAILILMVDPMKCLYFIIMILILQQLDGNVIGPLIQGDRTGMSGFWIIASITVFGGLFGIVGIVIAVPMFAVLYMWLKNWIDRKLKKRKMSQCSATYMETGCIYESDPVDTSSDPGAPEPKIIDPEARAAAQAASRRSSSKTSGWIQKLRNKKNNPPSKQEDDPPKDE